MKEKCQKCGIEGKFIKLCNKCRYSKESMNKYIKQVKENKEMPENMKEKIIKLCEDTIKRYKK